MPPAKASEFEAGVAGRAENRCFKFRCHQIFFNSNFLQVFFFKSNRSIRLLLFFVEAYLSITMHKYSSILNGLAELSSRKPRWGLRVGVKSGVVLMTK